MPGVFEFEGTLNRAALSGAFETLIARHESLRTVFRETEEGEVRQHILPAAESGFKLNDHVADQPDEEAIRQLVHSDLSRSFDLSNGPLLRATLYELGDQKWIFSYVMHHIISDGWSMEVLIRELLQFYDARVEGLDNPLPALRIHYKDYAAWEQAGLTTAAFQRHQQYWLQQFSGELPVLEFPSDEVRPLVKTYNGASLHEQIDAGLTAG